jgi:hypothetical protein
MRVTAWRELAEAANQIIPINARRDNRPELR